MAAGLRALLAVLKAEGGLGLMLYGELGRTGVYPLQRALTRLTGGGQDDAARLALARRLLEELPEGNWFRRNPLLADHLEGVGAVAQHRAEHRARRIDRRQELNHRTAASPAR